MNKITTKVAVAVFGPNLSASAQRLGTFHVHAEGCGDCKHYGYGRKFGGDNAPGQSDMVIKVTSQWDVADFIYGPDAGDFDSTVTENMSDFHFAACLRHLPAMTEDNRAEEAARATATLVEVAPTPPARTVTTVEDALAVLADANADAASIDAALALLA